MELFKNIKSIFHKQPAIMPPFVFQELIMSGNVAESEKTKITHMLTELEKKVTSIESSLEGFRAANRRAHEETEMHLSLLSKVREELDQERGKVRRLEQEVTQINAFVNKSASHAAY